MVGDILQPTHLLLILVVALLVLGPKRLPEVGRTLGSGLRDFRNAINGDSSHHEEPDDPPPSVAAPPQPAADAAPTLASDEPAYHEPTTSTPPPGPAAPTAPESPGTEAPADDHIAGDTPADEHAFALESSEPAAQRTEPSA